MRPSPFNKKSGVPKTTRHKEQDAQDGFSSMPALQRPRRAAVISYAIPSDSSVSFDDDDDKDDDYIEIE